MSVLPPKTAIEVARAELLKAEEAIGRNDRAGFAKHAGWASEVLALSAEHQRLIVQLDEKGLLV